VSAVTASVIVIVMGMVLMAGLVAFAIYVKGTVRASGQIGQGAFQIETTEKRR
jgi:hypothetical protein